jgi:hypothetical protein
VTIIPKVPDFKLGYAEKERQTPTPAPIEASRAVDPRLSNPGPSNNTGPGIQQAPAADSSDRRAEKID